MKDRLIHAYFDIDYRLVWDAVNYQVHRSAEVQLYQFTGFIF